MKNWRFILILLTFERIEVIVSSNNIIIMILEAMDNYEDEPLPMRMTSKWICLECDGDVVFQGHHNKVIA
jgi:hypothetical protein